MQAFVTFTTQEAKERCLQFYRKKFSIVNFILRREDDKENLLQMDDCDIAIVPAPEVTNVVWENLSVHYETVLKNQFLTTLAIITLLVIVLLTFLMMKAYATSKLFSFPPSTNCDAISNLFKVKDAKGNLKVQWKNFEKYAIADKVPTLAEHGIGTY